MHIRTCLAFSLTLLAAAAAGAAEPNSAEQYAKMQTRTELMQRQMQELQQAKTASERQEILRQHMQTLREHMHQTCAAPDFPCDGDKGMHEGHCGCQHHGEQHPSKKSA